MSQPPKITFVSRKPCRFVSIERVFQQVSASLERLGYSVGQTALPFGSNAIGVLLNLIFFRQPKVGIFHVTGHTHFAALRLPKASTVLTIHDLRFLEFGAGIRRWLIRKLFLDWPVKRCAVVTAVSEATREAILRETRCSPDKVVVVPNPLREEFLSGRHLGSGQATPVILQVGTMENKNLIKLIDALAGMDVLLRIVGRLSDEQLTHLNVNRIAFESVSQVDSAGMVEVYCQADVLAFCSTSEGFGLPIIEAQAVGLPVVTSNIKPMRDVAGDGALLVDPFDVVSIRQGIEAILKDAALRNKLVTHGLANVRRFEADAVATSYAGIYRRLSGGLTA